MNNLCFFFSSLAGKNVEEPVRRRVSNRKAKIDAVKRSKEAMRSDDEDESDSDSSWTLRNDVRSRYLFIHVRDPEWISRI
jgi:hypothetical protein